MAPSRREFLTLGIGAFAVAVWPATLRGRSALVRRSQPLMGTIAEIAVRHPDRAWADRSITAAFEALWDVESKMTRFRQDSDVGRMNALAGQATASVHPETEAVLRAALRWAEASEGRFDPCLGAATELWDPLTRERPPNDGDRYGGRSLWRTLAVESDGVGVEAGLGHADARVDLGGIAKGYGVDAAAQVLREHGVFHGLINVGGDLIALGVDAEEEPWAVGVRSPWQADQIVHRLRVSDAAIATSGDYLRGFEYRGRRYHHLLDPRTGEPRETSMRSLTVEAESCMAADAAATALFGASSDQAERLIRRAPSPIQITHEVREALP